MSENEVDSLNLWSDTLGPQVEPQEPVVELVDQTIEDQPDAEGQLAMFELTEWWEVHWHGMPEFSQKDISPHRTLYVHFETREDVTAFFQLVNQHYTPRTQYIWYPKMEPAVFSDKRYVDEVAQ